MGIYEYVNGLERYLDEKIDYEILGNWLKVYVDNEIFYAFDWSDNKIDIYERNIKTEIGSWNTEKEAKVNFAMLMRVSFKNDKDNTMPDEIKECDSLDKLECVIEKYLDKKYYSIGSVQNGKLSIISDDGYKILFRTDNKKYRIDDDIYTDTKYIFERFYYEVFYYALFVKNLNDYEEIFNETFSEAEMINLIGYKNHDYCVI